jgi:soluble lytic murein transglycosylase-like protein
MSQSNTPNRMTALGLLEQMRRRASANREPEFNPMAAAARERGQAPRASLFGGQRQPPLPIPPTPPAVIPPPQTQQAAPQARGQAQALPVPPVPPAVIPQQEGAPARPIAERFNPQNPHVATAIEMAERYGLPRNVFLSLVQQESRFDPNAVSRAGALGLGQLMPGTARDLGVDPTNPTQNLEGSARYLRQQLDRFGGDMTLALAAYNAGPRRVIEAGNAIPDNAETQAYVPSVMRRAGVPGYAEGGTVTAIPVHEINVVATRLPRRRTPRPAPREELTADQLNAMVLDRLAARYDVAPESIMAAEARDRIGRAMGYAYGGLANLHQRYADGGIVSGGATPYDPNAVNALANQIEAGYV